jgi:incFII family plasmid replication initiator RepA
MSQKNISFSSFGQASYVCNPDPEFITPKHHKARPLFIRKAFNYANARRVWMWEGFSYFKIQAKRKRRFNKHRAKAIQAGVLCMTHHLNIVSGMVEASCTDMAEMCGLSTHSKAGNLSISRFTRMIDDLETFGLIKTEKVWDRVMGTWIPKMIWVTDIFFLMIGIKPDEYNAAQNQQLGYLKSQLTTVEEKEQLTITEAKRRKKHQFIEKAFEARKKKHSSKRLEKQAKDFAKKGLDEQRSEIANNLASQLNPEELKGLSLQDFKSLVDRRLGQLRHSTEPPSKL